MAEKEIIKETKEEKSIIEDKGQEEKELLEARDKGEIEPEAEEKMAEKEKEENEKEDKEEKSEEKDKEESEAGVKTTLSKEDATKKPFKRLTREERVEEEKKRALEEWKPKTLLGKKVRNKEIKKIDDIIDKKILEPEIIDSLVHLESDLLAIGQAKGKFGGGKRRAWKQTQRKTGEGNIPSFGCLAVVGDKKGHVGIGSGKAKETLPAREKALRKAKLNIIKVIRGCGSFDCICEEEHSIPFKVEGKCGSSKVILYPAPQGTGLVIGDECKKILSLAGIEDIYSKTFGQTKTTINLIKACMDALSKTRRDQKGVKKK